MNALVRGDFRAANNLRFGLELNPVPGISLRGGYASYGSMLHDSGAMFYDPVPYRQESISGGLGYRAGNISLDLTYVNSVTNFSEYDQFYYRGENNYGWEITLLSGEINTKRNRDLVALSFGVRF